MSVPPLSAYLPVKHSLLVKSNLALFTLTQSQQFLAMGKRFPSTACMFLDRGVTLLAWAFIFVPSLLFQCGIDYAKEQPCSRIPDKTFSQNRLNIIVQPVVLVDSIVDLVQAQDCCMPKVLDFFLFMCPCSTFSKNNNILSGCYSLVTRPVSQQFFLVHVHIYWKTNTLS